MAEFENMAHRLDKINATLMEYGMGNLDDAEKVCKDAGMDPLPYDIVKSVQPICFEDAAWAYTAGAAIAIKKGVANASEAASAIGIGLQAFTTPGSVADDRKVGLGHGNLGAMLLKDETECFAFLAGHESFAAAEGAIGIVKNANKARKKPLRVILNGLGKDHQSHQRIYLRANAIRLCNRRAQDRQRNPLLCRRARRCALLRRR